jgi:hypothetical protein
VSFPDQDHLVEDFAANSGHKRFRDGVQIRTTSWDFQRPHTGRPQRLVELLRTTVF